MADPKVIYVEFTRQEAAAIAAIIAKVNIGKSAVNLGAAYRMLMDELGYENAQNNAFDTAAEVRGVQDMLHTVTVVERKNRVKPKNWKNKGV